MCLRCLYGPFSVDTTDLSAYLHMFTPVFLKLPFGNLTVMLNIVSKFPYYSNTSLVFYKI